MSASRRLCRPRAPLPRRAGRLVQRRRRRPWRAIVVTRTVDEVQDRASRGRGQGPAALQRHSLPALAEDAGRAAARRSGRTSAGGPDERGACSATSAAGGLAAGQPAAHALLKPARLGGPRAGRGDVRDGSHRLVPEGAEGTLSEGAGPSRRSARTRTERGALLAVLSGTQGQPGGGPLGACRNWVWHGGSDGGSYRPVAQPMPRPLITTRGSWCAGAAGRRPEAGATWCLVPLAPASSSQPRVVQRQVHQAPGHQVAYAPPRLTKATAWSSSGRVACRSLPGPPARARPVHRLKAPGSRSVASTRRSTAQSIWIRWCLADAGDAARRGRGSPR